MPASSAVAPAKLATHFCASKFMTSTFQHISPFLASFTVHCSERAVAFLFQSYASRHLPFQAVACIIGVRTFLRSRDYIPFSFCKGFGISCQFNDNFRGQLSNSHKFREIWVFKALSNLNSQKVYISIIMYYNI